MAGWQFSRSLLRLAQRFWPIPLLFGRARPVLAFVTRNLDVQEVLNRTEVFSVALYNEKMKSTTGRAFLGFGETPEYQREIAIVRSVFHRNDFPRLRQYLGEQCRELIDEIVRTRAVPEVDVVRDLANVMPARLVRHYYGIQEPDDRALHALYQKTSNYIFFFWTFAVGEIEAVRTAVEIRRLVDEHIQRRHKQIAAGEETPDDLLGRFLDLQQTDPGNSFDDEGVSRTLGGLASGTIIPPTGIFSKSIDRLMDLPLREFEKLQEAARAGEDEMVREYLLEAGRFTPYPPFLYRYCEHDTTLAEGTKGSKTIPRGTTVVALLTAASADGSVIPNPDTFRPGRPNWQYPQYGHGQHFCLGAELSLLLFTEMAKPLLSLRGLRRAAGRRGALISNRLLEGKYPVHFFLAFDR